MSLRCGDNKYKHGMAVGENIFNRGFPHMETKLYNDQSFLRVFNWRWYKDQMTGWSKNSYRLLFIGILLQLAFGFGGGITPLGTTATIAGIIGFTCTIAITNGKPINGILGIISALLLIYVAIKTGNNSDVLMQAFYVIFLDIPILFVWKAKKVIPRKLAYVNKLETALTFMAFLVLTYFIDTHIFISPRPIVDALSATIGLTGAVLTVRGFRASYYFWTAQGLASVVLWILTAMDGHAVWVLMFTYMLYLANDAVSFLDKDIAWFHHKEEKPFVVVDDNFVDDPESALVPEGVNMDDVNKQVAEKTSDEFKKEHSKRINQVKTDPTFYQSEELYKKPSDK